MRYYGLLLLLTLALVSCTSGTTGQGPAAVISGQEADASPYQLLIASSDITTQDNRMVLTLWDGPERFQDGKSVHVTLFSLDGEGTAKDKVWEGETTPYVMGDMQYWVAYPTLPAAGSYGIQSILTTNTDQTFENRALVTVKEDAEAPATGEPVPATDTLTLADVNSVQELSSAGPWIEDFYRVNIADAAASGKVSVIAFATPGHCTSALCAPVLLTLSNVYETHKTEDLNFVHIEIWRDFEKEYLDPAVTDWNLPSEPWVFILNADGTVGSRLDGPVSVEEIEGELSRVLAGEVTRHE